jgi:hypothetical protein
LEFTPDLFMGRNDKRTRERELSKRARNEIIGSGEPMCSPECMKKTGFLLEFTPDLFLYITHKYQEAGIPPIFS